MGRDDIMNNRKTSAKVMLATATLAVMAAAMPACETVKGVGRDVQTVGGGVEKASEGTQDAIDGKK